MVLSPSLRVNKFSSISEVWHLLAVLAVQRRFEYFVNYVNFIVSASS